MTLDELNGLERDRFVDTMGWLFEHSPWVAARAWSRRPFADVERLHAAMAAEIAAARPDEQVALLCAHPDLGTRARVSVASAGEQAGAGLDRLTHEEYVELLRLTSTYRQRFGFPFLLAVKGKTTAEVVSALRARLSSDLGAEHAEALRQVCLIARLRLQDVIP